MQRLLKEDCHDRSGLKTRIADMFTPVSVLPMRNQSGNPKENK